MKYIIKFGLSILSMPVFSRMYGWLTKRRRPVFLINIIIRFFVNTYDISMDEFEGDVEDYHSLNEIFLRRFAPAVRPLKKDDKFILSPADGILSNLELVKEDKAFQIKGSAYSISELINEKIDFSKGWYVATIYLSPKDYHRFHYPASGELESYCHLRGRLYPVNSIGLNNIKELFIKNERIAVKTVINEFPLYFIAVGATFVGSIKMEFINRYGRDNIWKKVNVEISQLDEMGRFELGSTIVMLFPEEPAESLVTGNSERVKVGDKLFRLK